MVNKSDIISLLNRIWQLLVNPLRIWPDIFAEDKSVEVLFKTYFFPATVMISVLVFAAASIWHPFWYCLRYAVCVLISSCLGIYLSWMCIKEYLAAKVASPKRMALNLSVYCSIIFFFFNHLAAAIAYHFLSQVFNLFSLLFLRTLYVGIQQVNGIHPKVRTNLFIISAVSIIVIPTIIRKLTTILFHLPVLNL